MPVVKFPPGGGGQKSKAKGKPSLSDLHGMPEVVAWGRTLAADLDDYRQGLLAWSDIDSGILLHGPPGCGKTTVARAVAEHCGASFHPTSYAAWQADDNNIGLGHVLQRMKDVFTRAREHSPAILFIDEIDAIYSRDIGSKNQDWNNYILNALLPLIDGADSARDGIIVIAATNRPQALDPALLRSGRLTRKVEIPAPNEDGLAKIFRYYLGKGFSDAQLKSLAVSCAGKTGADIEYLVQEARRKARHLKRPLEISDITSQIHPGAEREELRRHAIHEAGHAIAAIRLLNARVSVSLAQSNFSLGRTSIQSSKTSETRADIMDRIAVSLGGRAAEDISLGYTTNGCGGGENSDLAYATQLAFKAVSVWGLSKHSQPLLWIPDFAPGASGFPELTQDACALLQESYGPATSCGSIGRALKPLPTCWLSASPFPTQTSNPSFRSSPPPFNRRKILMASPQDMKQWRDLAAKTKSDFNRAAVGTEKQRNEEPGKALNREPAIQHKLQGAESERFPSRRAESHRQPSMRGTGRKASGFDIG